LEHVATLAHGGELCVAHVVEIACTSVNLSGKVRELCGLVKEGVLLLEAIGLLEAIALFEGELVVLLDLLVLTQVELGLLHVDGVVEIVGLQLVLPWRVEVAIQGP